MRNEEMVALYRLLSTLDVRRLRHSGLDPESRRTPRDVPTFQHIEGILNRVQDDGGATACAASHVSHSGLDPESPRSLRPTSDPRRVLCPHNTLSSETDRKFPLTRGGVVGGQHPTFDIKASHREAYQNHSLFTIHYSQKTSAGGF